MDSVKNFFRKAARVAVNTTTTTCVLAATFAAQVGTLVGTDSIGVGMDTAHGMGATLLSLAAAGATLWYGGKGAAMVDEAIFKNNNQSLNHS